VEKNTAFAKELKVDYPILSDPEHTVSDAFGVTNETRKVPQRWTHYIGPDGKVLFIDKGVKAGSHGADVAAKLAELGVAKAE
jgi:peroxiredoxin Q/BCP